MRLRDREKVRGVVIGKKEKWEKENKALVGLGSILPKKFTNGNGKISP